MDLMVRLGPISPTGNWRKARSESPTGPKRSGPERGPGLDILRIRKGGSPVGEILSNDRTSLGANGTLRRLTYVRVDRIERKTRLACR
jgi:hypothetical protein